MIVFDSSTLILLAKKELLDLFLDDFEGGVAVPKAVRVETCVKGSFDALLIEKRMEEDKINVYDAVEKKEQLKKLIDNFKLGLGEAEALLLCIDKRFGILATDDKNAINACKVLRIRFTTAINILLRLYEKQLIERDKALMKIDNLKVVGRYKEESGGIEKMSIGIEGKDYSLIEELSKIEGEEKSKVLEELMELGRMMFALRRYEEGKLSLGKAAEIAGMSLSEFMDLLSEFGIKSRISYEDYLEGFDNLKEVW